LKQIEQIEKYAYQGEEAFKRDELIQTWMVHHIQIVGEAARALSEDVKKKYPVIPWSDIIGMRNILVHDYFGINKEVVWNVVSRHLLDLKREVENIVSDFKGYRR
jgi:uncharacterized protein with HEPN domain